MGAAYRIREKEMVHREKELQFMGNERISSQVIRNVEGS